MLRLLLPALALSLSACATVTMQREPVPVAAAATATVAGFGPEIRYWGDEAPPELAGDAEANARAFAERNAALIRAGKPVPMAFLVLSGGGENGAFGAGLLNGWSQAGDRPTFQIVTGVSTGAIIAPFAFLGEAYDDALHEAYTDIAPSDIYDRKLWANLLGGAALSDVTPLASMIERYIDEDMLAAIAAEHATGRRLLVSTTNLDTGRPVIWDMGAIAAYGDDRALRLFRDVVRASASIPALFPPVPISAAVDGEVYTELHADGGVAANLFAYAPQVELGKLLADAPFETEVTVYVVRNGRSTPAYAETKPTWYGVAGRSVGLLLFHSAQASIAQTYHLAQRDGLNFRLAIFPDDFTDEPTEPFEQAYMRRLFGAAEAAAQEGYEWRRSPF